MPKRRTELSTELARIVDQLTAEILRAVRSASLAELDRVPEKHRASNQHRRLLAQLAERLRDAGVARLDGTVRERQGTRRRRSSR
jgi:hypothetical protein